MGWGRMLLLGDLGQQLDLSDQSQELEALRAKIGAERTRRERSDERLEREHQELKLYLAALVRLLIAKQVIGVEEIRQIVDVLDREDAEPDGAFGGPVVPER